MTDDELRDLIEQAHNLREMQQQEGYAAWHAHTSKRIEAKKREMIAGVPETVEAYRYTAGWIEGAEYALGALEQLDRRILLERERRKERQAA